MRLTLALVGLESDISNKKLMRVISGVIYYRFESESLELHEVGRYLKTMQTEEFQPYFVIEDQQDVLVFDPSSVKPMHFLTRLQGRNSVHYPTQ